MMPHGSVTRYAYNRCRCLPCTEAASRYYRAYRNGLQPTRADRSQLAADYAEDILLLAPDHRAREIATRNEIPLCVVLRVLVPHYLSKGLDAQQIAERLGVSDRSVFRHKRRIT